MNWAAWWKRTLIGRKHSLPRETIHKSSKWLPKLHVNNPFAFFTQCIKHSFIQYLNQEKRQRNIRDLILVDQGLNPSFSFLENGTEQQNRFADDEQDYHAITHEAQQLKQTPKDPSTDDAIDFPDEDSAVTVDQDDDSRDDAR